MKILTQHYDPLKDEVVIEEVFKCKDCGIDVYYRNTFDCSYFRTKEKEILSALQTNAQEVPEYCPSCHAIQLEAAQ